LINAEGTGEIAFVDADTIVHVRYDRTEDDKLVSFDAE
jgi:hypothetical protein